MCGIVGYAGKRNAVEVLLKGLKRLEYRGYDSAGIALFDDQNKIEIYKSEGKLERVKSLLPPHLHSAVGIGHTRWATHGKPTTQNAHPHQTGPYTLVHNGIIENYTEIKEKIKSLGHEPLSQTDSELFGYLLLEEQKTEPDLVFGFAKAFQKVHGYCTFVALHADHPDTVIAVRNGSPLVVAVDPEGGVILASDAQPCLDYTQDVIFLEDFDVVVIKNNRFEIFKVADLVEGKKRPVLRLPTRLTWSADRLDKEGFAHYMQKEIFEQPTSMIDTLNALIDRARPESIELADPAASALLKNGRHIQIVACGTSYHAGLLGKYWIEALGQISVSIEVSSEFRYRQVAKIPRTLVLAISQSGETADTLAVVRQAKELGIPTLGLTNVKGSTLARECAATLYLCAGPEIGVAATKTFSSQLTILWTLALWFAKNCETTPGSTLKMFNETLKVPHHLKNLLDDADFIKKVKASALAISKSKSFFFIGRGVHYPLALEGALKLKEIAYVHAEGYPAGELKHGPIAMIDNETCVIAIAPKDAWHEKTLSNIEEVKARGAKVLGLGSTGDAAFAERCDWSLLVSGENEPLLNSFSLLCVLQLLSYEVAVLKGTEIDQPRNLAKSVTVE